MNRRPIYHKENDHSRVVYRPGGWWAAQVRSDRQPSNTRDHWDDIGPLLERDEAVQLMYSRYPLKPKG